MRLLVAAEAVGTPLAVLAAGMILAGDDRAAGRQDVFRLAAAVLFLCGIFAAAGVEWLIRRERRLARDGVAADVVMVTDAGRRHCYGLTDAVGRPLLDSPPIRALTPEQLQAGERKTVLYDPAHCTLLHGVQFLRFVRIEA